MGDLVVLKDRFAPCPCSSKVVYHKCCKPYHDGALPETALLLMRSRYAAYALGLADYLIETTHPDHPAYESDFKSWKIDLINFSRGTSFHGLKILEFVDGDETASVSFSAYLQQNGHDSTFSEKSTFIKQDGRWLYQAGELAEVPAQT